MKAEFMVPVPHLRLAAPRSTAEDMFRRNAKYVARLGFRLLGRDEGLDDLVQDVFLAATAAQLTTKNEHEQRGWLATVTVRMAGRILRRRRLARFFGLDDGPAERLMSPGAPADTVVFVAQLYRRLDAVPAAERVAWTLRHIEDEPLETVAVLCGVSLATAKRRIAAVQRVLQHAAEDGGGDGDET
jgi:RNA polymerase sigma-70 factor (ECF subfamily)